MSSSSPAPHAGHRALRRLRLGAGELLLVSALYVVYRLGRVLAADRAETERGHARLVHDLEALLRLPSEAAIQDAVHSVPLLELANLYYVSAHFPVTIAFLVWGFLVRPRAEYLWARRTLVVLTLSGLVTHIAFPLAPPRMFPEWGFLDTMTTYGPSAYDGTSGALVNQYAAMPSLHVGWAVLIAVVVVRTGRRPVAALACLHAATTTAVVVVTANHWFLDALVAVTLLAGALALVPGPRRGRARPAAVRAAAVAPTPVAVGGSRT